MTNPQAAVQPSAQAARDQVNQNYAGLADRVNQQFLTTGGGQSGKAGDAYLQAQLGRAGQLAGVDQTAQVQASQLPLTAAQLAEQFLGQSFGQTTSGSSSTSQTGTQSGTQSGSQSGFGVGVGNPNSGFKLF